MNFCLITFRSVTPAQRGENGLRRNGFTCLLQRTPKWMEEQGCGYSLRLQPKDAPAAVALLRKQKIPFRKVYLYRDSDVAEELTL